MLKGRLKEKANAQPEMSCSNPGGTGTPWGVLAQPARESDVASPGVSGPQAGLASGGSPPAAPLLPRGGHQ